MNDGAQNEVLETDNFMIFVFREAYVIKGKLRLTPT